MIIRVRRGLEANRLSYTPQSGEPVFTTDTKKLYIGDGSTPGGILVDMQAGIVQTVVAGTNVTVDNTDPENPIVSATLDSAVDSVNGLTGTVVLDTDDISDSGATHKFATAAEKTKLGFIAVTQAVDLDAIESTLASHVANTSNPHSVTKAQVGLGNVPNTDFTADVAANNAKISFDSASSTKLAGIEALADVTDAGNVGSSIHGASAKTTPVDADTVPLIDSAASNVLKKLSWANIKATLKTYLDTLYQPLATVLTNTTAAFTTALETKLNGIEAGADVTDATNVDAAGATMNSDTSLAGNGYFLDEDNFASNSATKVPSQQSTKAYVDAQVAAGGGVVDTIVAGDNIDVDSTDPSNPIVSVEALTKSDVGLGNVDNVQQQPLDSDLTSWAGVTRASGFDTFAGTPSGANLASLLTSALPASKGGTGLTALAANVVSLLGAADYAAMRTQLSLGSLATLSTVGTSQIDDAAVTLAKMANLAQDQFIGRTTASTGVPQTATITAAARTVLDDTTVDAMLNTLGGATAEGTGAVVRKGSPTLTTPNLGTPSAVVLTNATGLPATGLTASAITLGYAKNTASFSTSSTSDVLITGLSINVTRPGSRNVKVTVHTGQIYNTASTTTWVSIYTGATSGALTTLKQSAVMNSGGISTSMTIPVTCIYVDEAPAAGSIYYSGAMHVGAGTGTFYTAAAAPGFIEALAV